MTYSVPGIGLPILSDDSLVLTYIGQVQDSTDRTTYTFTGVPLGGIGSGFLIACPLYYQSSGAQNTFISSVTIDGLTGTKIYDGEDNIHSLVAGCGMFGAPASVLSSGNVQVVMNRGISAMTLIMVHLRASQIQVVDTAFKSISDAGGDQNVSVETEETGAALGLVTSWSNAANEWSWAGLDTEWAGSSAGHRASVGMTSRTPAANPRSVIASRSGAAGGGHCVAVSFGR